jgi:hypothetical protein
MKKNYFVKFSILFLLTVFFVYSGSAQIRMVLVNPLNEKVTIKNFGGSTVDISNYYLCIFPSYPRLGSLSVISGDLNLTSGSEVTVKSSTDLVESGGELGLYANNSNFGNSANIRDYLQWITNGGTRESVAVSAGIWGAGDAIPGTVSQPYQYTGNGSETGVEFWGQALSADDFALHGFSISPNPATSNLILQVPGGSNKIDVEIFDVLGKKIFDNGFINTPIDISDWSKGVYLVKVSSDNNVQTKRFVKQ